MPALLAALFLCSIVHVAPAPSTSTAPTEKFRLFLGPSPSEDGFINTNKDFQDSYEDLAKEYESDKRFHSVMVLVTNRDEADLILEVTFRNRPAFLANAQLRATLSVVGSEFRVEMDGRTGQRNTRWSIQAKGLLRQTVDWINANRAACDNVRASRAPKDAAP
jgi:hypothetical protein